LDELTRKFLKDKDALYQKYLNDMKNVREKHKKKKDGNN